MALTNSPFLKSLTFKLIYSVYFSFFLCLIVFRMYIFMIIGDAHTITAVPVSYFSSTKLNTGAILVFSTKHKEHGVWMVRYFRVHNLARGHFEWYDHFYAPGAREVRSNKVTAFGSTEIVSFINDFSSLLYFLTFSWLYFITFGNDYGVLNCWFF